MKIHINPMMQWFCIAMLAGGWSRAMADAPVYSLDSRLRFEEAEQSGLSDADNLSLRIRPGVTSPSWKGLQAMAQGEFTFIADRNAYNAAGVYGDSSSAVIADPENRELDQAWVSYTQKQHSLKLGRQVIALDDHRWIGNVGWRQNQQTYDAVTWRGSGPGKFTAFYGYLDQAIRIFGNEAPHAGGNAASFGSDSHLFQLASPETAYGKCTTYYYHLRLKDAPPVIAGSDTLGLLYALRHQLLEEVTMGMTLEAARQTDGGDHPDHYAADYLHLEGQLELETLVLRAGWEKLGGDQVGEEEDGRPRYASLQTPLATLHKFNGFADAFLTTPPKGLEDRYASIGYTVVLGEKVGPLTLTAIRHEFQTDIGGETLGTENDFVVTKPIPLGAFPGQLKLIAKYADFNGSDGKDVERTILELDYAVSF